MPLAKPTRNRSIVFFCKQKVKCGDVLFIESFLVSSSHETFDKENRCFGGESIVESSDPTQKPCVRLFRSSGYCVATWSIYRSSRSVKPGSVCLNGHRSSTRIWPGRCVCAYNNSKERPETAIEHVINFGPINSLDAQCEPEAMQVGPCCTRTDPLHYY